MSRPACRWRAALALLGLLSAAAADPCAHLRCPAACARPDLARRHPCCPRPVCDCFDARARVFRPVGARWASPDCAQDCICRIRLDPATFRKRATPVCRPLRCPTSRAACAPGLEACCPVCGPRTAPCRSAALGRDFAEGQTWRESACRECSCSGGRNLCSDKECPHLPCPEGRPGHALPHECCPSFCRDDNSTVRPHQSCLAPGAGSLPHGSARRPRWPCSPLRCACRHGEWECDRRSAACPAHCLHNRTVRLGPPGACCPLCAGAKACLRADGSYASAGRVWTEEDGARQCACVHGVVECLRREAASTAAPGGDPRGPPSWLAALLALLALAALLLLLLLLLACAVRRRHPRAWALLRAHLDWPGHRRAAGAAKASFSKQAGVRLPVDENANPRPEPLLA